MSGWRQYAFSLIACSLCSGIVTQLVSNSKGKNAIRLISGIVMAISIVHPLSEMNLNKIYDLENTNRIDADYYIAEGTEAAFEEKKRCITAACEAYILDKAHHLDAEIDVAITVNQEYIPLNAKISYKSEKDVQMELQNILETDLGIPKENQIWIWNQESCS